MKTSLTCMLLAVSALFASSACARPGIRGLNDGLDDAEEESSSTSLPPGAHVVRDVAYGPDPAQRLDVYVPQAAKQAPVILMVHGGGWRRGDKGMASVVANKVARFVPEGVIVVSTNYRMIPDADPLVQAEDVARAMAYVQRHAGSWGGDPTRLVAMGHSAGAHLVALLMAEPSILTRVGGHLPLGAVSLDSGALDVVEIMQARHFPLYDRAFGSSPEFWRAASPTLQLGGKTVPMLMVCSSRRRNSCPQADRFAARAADFGSRVDVLPVDLSHREINVELGEPGGYTESVEGFLRKVGLLH